MKIRYFLIVLWLGTTSIYAKDWMPDPALRENLAFQHIPL